MNSGQVSANVNVLKIIKAAQANRAAAYAPPPFDLGVAVEHPPGLTRPGSFMTRKSVPFTTSYSVKHDASMSELGQTRSLGRHRDTSA
jgi:hypothetical protein